jgi:PiT family inorganic phosphate transporter
VKTFTSGILSRDVGYPALLPFAVLGGSISWVFIASRLGWPVSTTHSITGAICGAALISIGIEGIQWGSLIYKVAIPLLLSPLLSLVVTFLIFPLLHKSLSGWEGHCLCVLPAQPVQVAQQGGGLLRVLPAESKIVAVTGTTEQCQGQRSIFLTLNLDSFHWLTSGLVSLARGMNDAPKIVAILVTLSFLSETQALRPDTPLLVQGFIVVALGMGLGSWLAGRQVTEVLAERVTRMDHLQGFSANLTTAILVTAAAKFGLPVSTTHVSSCELEGCR